MPAGAPCLDLGNALNQTNTSAEAAAVATPVALPVVTLTRGMVRGDESAYRCFHEAYCQRLYRYLLVVAAGDEEAAREALQAAFVRVVRHIKVFDDEARFWNWLAVLARTAFLDQSRKQRRYFSFLDRFTRQARAESAACEDGQAETRLFALLDKNMVTLPPDELDLVKRKYFLRQRVRQMAEDLQTTEKAVESRLGRVRRKLKEAILSELKHEPAE